MRRFLRSFFNRLIKGKSLPNNVSPDEDLARNLIGGSSPRSIKKLFDPKNNTIKPSQFFDNRNPRELSVNRISTLTTDEAHRLGLELKDEINNKNPNQSKVYHGFGKLKVKTCIEAGCTKVEKEDYDGLKPYHANIIYPEKDKYEEMEIANILAFKAELIRYVLAS